MFQGFQAHAQDAKTPEPKPFPEYVRFKNPAHMIVHSDQTIEMKRSEFGTSIITPEDKLYIRNNVKAPGEDFVADRDGWQVEIKGVKNPKTLTVAELKTLGLTTVTMVLQCSGNGRAYFQEKVKGTDQKISGTPWTVGAAGCVMWTGVPLKAVVEALGGVESGAKYITGTGGEKIPEGINPLDVMVERSVPVKTLDDVILAWDLSGKPISLAHGGPLRMIVPGYSGVNNVKYVKTVAFTAEQSQAKIQKTGYRMHKVGEKGAPDQPSIWEMEVKSWVTVPLGDVKAGRNQISGFAFGGMNAVKSVEVSVDGGETWSKAELVGPDMGRFAWRQFVLSADLKPGSYTLVSRATDSQGAVQPKEPEINGSGYSHNGWLAPGVKITVA
ncbi:MAG: sulfite oxidase [Hyphomicrobiales bacterium]|nr:sulfite oxidase [Hyphomicrobiales bacterium]